jgi:hypothetical protein
LTAVCKIAKYICASKAKQTSNLILSDQILILIRERKLSRLFVKLPKTKFSSNAKRASNLILSDHNFMLIRENQI